MGALLRVLREQAGRPVTPLRWEPAQSRTPRPAQELSERARRGQAIGSDMPAGFGAAAGAGACITGSSIGESAIRPRAP